MNFSTNQARHLFVANSYEDQSLTSSSAAGAITLKSTQDNDIYFSYKGKGGLLRSDLINVKNLISVKATDAAKMRRPLKSVVMTLKDGHTIVAGQDYILRVVISQFSSLGEESDYIKFGAVRGISGMSESDFYKTMALSLARNFSKEITDFFTIHLNMDAEDVGDPTEVEVTATTKSESLTDTYTGIALTEKEQDWVLGIKASVPVNFRVVGNTVTDNKVEVEWLSQTEVDADTVGNGKVIADLEYFCMGERGDIYRNVGWPYVIKTEYMVDPTQEYYTLDIHYAYVGSNESVQKSEKDLTIVSTTKAVINSIVGAINTAAGTSFATLV